MLKPARMRSNARFAGRLNIGYEHLAMTDKDTNNKAAMQYLIWALEELEKGGNATAAEHARKAIVALHGASRPDKVKERS